MQATGEKPEIDKSRGGDKLRHYTSEFFSFATIPANHYILSIKARATVIFALRGADMIFLSWWLLKKSLSSWNRNMALASGRQAGTLLMCS
jgi:hypothetical protein